MLRVPSSQALQQSPSGSDAAAAAFAEATEGDAKPEDSQTAAADESDAVAAQLRLQVAFPVGAAGGSGPRTQLRLPPPVEALIGEPMCRVCHGDMHSTEAVMGRLSGDVKLILIWDATP